MNNIININSISNNLKMILKGKNNPEDYKNKSSDFSKNQVNFSDKILSDLNYLLSTGEHKKYSQIVEDLAKRLNTTQAERFVFNLLPRNIDHKHKSDEYLSYQKIAIKNFCKNIKELAEIVVKFLNKYNGDHENTKKLSQDINNINDIFFWNQDLSKYDIDNTFFPTDSFNKSIAALKYGVENSNDNKEYKYKYFLENGFPSFIMDIGGVFGDVNLNDRAKSFYKDNNIRANNHYNCPIDLSDLVKKMDLNKFEQNIIYSTKYKPKAELNDMPKRLAENFIKNNEKKAISKTRCNRSGKEKKVIENVLGKEKTKEKINDFIVDKISNFFEEKNKMTSRKMRSYTSSISTKELKNFIKTYDSSKLQDLWDKFDFSNDETMTDTVRAEFTDLEVLDNISIEDRAEIIKSKIRSEDSFSFPSFEINKELLDEITDLQLIKFVNRICNNKEKLSEIADHSYYKNRFAKKVIGNDERATKASNKMKEIFNEKEKEDFIKENSNNKNKKTIEEKAKDGWNFIINFLEQFDSFSEYYEYKQENNLEHESVFDKIEDKLKIKTNTNNLKFTLRSSNKKNYKIAKDLAEVINQSFT